jgi:hypothetical protein
VSVGEAFQIELRDIVLRFRFGCWRGGHSPKRMLCVRPCAIQCIHDCHKSATVGKSLPRD